MRSDEFIATGKGPAAEAFGRLGIDAASLKEKLKDPSALFSEIIGKLGQLEKAAQIRIADEIFGGTGGEKFVQLIDQGEAGIRDTNPAEPNHESFCSLGGHLDLTVLRADGFALERLHEWPDSSGERVDPVRLVA